MKKVNQNSPSINKLKFSINNNEIDLCADINQQAINFANYVSSLNEYCINCEKQPCQCYLIYTI